jgi:hypothetical protein
MGFDGMGTPQVNREFFTMKGRNFIKVAKKPTSDDEAQALIDAGYQYYEYKNKDGELKSSYEMRFNNITGQIVACFEREGNFHIEQCIVIEDQNGEQAQISVKKYMNSQLENLMNRMCHPDFDVNQVVKLVPYSKPKVDGKKGYNEGVVIYMMDDQGRFIKKVEKGFKAPEKGKPADHDCPSWNSEKITKGEDKGKVKWDNNDTIEYLDNVIKPIMETVKPADWSWKVDNTEPECESESYEPEGEEVDL